MRKHISYTLPNSIMSHRETFYSSRFGGHYGVPKCHECTSSALFEEGSVQCTKCKSRTCKSCQEETPHDCAICEKSLCSRCLEHHYISDCKDCSAVLCFNTRKSTSDLLKREHIYCHGCKRYTCQKLPPSHLKRFMKEPHIFRHYCSQCIWKQIKCYFCKTTLNRSPYICDTCHAPVCEVCKSVGYFATDVRQCRGCELRTTRAELKLVRHEFSKMRKAYILSTLPPVISRYVKYFVS